MTPLVFPDPESLAAAALELLDGSVVALSGGSTYEAMLDRWRGPQVSGRTYLPVDERCVAFDDPASNWASTTRRFLAPNGMETQSSHWTSAATDLERLLFEHCPLDALSTPVLSQVWLGMGDDGHTASLFPEGTELADFESIALETTSPKPPHRRVTLGWRTIFAADEIFLVATGQTKGSVLKRALEGDANLPITTVLKTREIGVLVDRACARAAGL